MHKCLGICGLPELNQEDINNLYRSITNNTNKVVIKNSLTKEKSGPDGSLLNSTKPLK